MGFVAFSPRGRSAPTKRGGYSQLRFAAARGLGAAVAAREFFYPPSGVDEFLFAGKKRMAGGADADFNVSFGRAGVINRAARANDIGVLVIGMNIRLHSQKRVKKIAEKGQLRK